MKSHSLAYPLVFAAAFVSLGNAPPASPELQPVPAKPSKPLAEPPATRSASPIKIPRAGPPRPKAAKHLRHAEVITHRHRAQPMSVVAAATRAATQEPDAHGFVNAIQVYPYTDGTLYRVYTAPERVTDIALQPGEQLGAVASGDTVRWVIGDTTSGTGADKQVHILVKPFGPSLATNLVVTTDRRSYHLALTSSAGGAMTALSWTYPQDQLIALTHAADEAKAAAPVASGLALDQLHFNYAITGDKPTWRPMRAFDDGRQTFIEFPLTISTSETPPLFLVDAKGVAQLVNYRLQGRFYVVDRLFDAAELRLGTKHQDIVRITRTAEVETKRRRV